MIVAMQRLARRTMMVMGLWAVASLGWLAAVASVAWRQIEAQVAAGLEVARDVAALDCEGAPAAIAECLINAEMAVGVSWGDIAAVAWQYEAVTIVAWFFLAAKWRVASSRPATWSTLLAAFSPARPAVR